MLKRCGDCFIKNKIFVFTSLILLMRHLIMLKKTKTNNFYRKDYGGWLAVNARLTCLQSVKMQSGDTSAERLRQWWLWTWSRVSQQWSSPCARGRTRWSGTVQCGWARRWALGCTPPLSLWLPCGGSWGWHRTDVWAGSAMGQRE